LNWKEERVDGGGLNHSIGCEAWVLPPEARFDGVLPDDVVPCVEAAKEPALALEGADVWASSLLVFCVAALALPPPVLDAGVAGRELVALGIECVEQRCQVGELRQQTSRHEPTKFCLPCLPLLRAPFLSSSRPN
jgi:hypothetical protein